MHESLADVAARFRVPRLAEIAAADPRFAQVEYMVEADDFAYENLFNNWSPRISWEADPSECLVGLGMLIGCNVNIKVRFAHVDGTMTMFYHPCTDLIDYRMVETFIEDVRKLGRAARPCSMPAHQSKARGYNIFMNFCHRS
jgi:hypothetical protein